MGKKRGRSRQRQGTPAEDPVPKRSSSTPLPEKKPIKTKKRKKAPKVEDESTLLLSKHKHLSRVESAHGSRIKCMYTGHEMKVEIDVVRKYLGSKTLQKAKEKWFSDDWVEKYLPHIVAHKTNPEKKLFCTLTKLPLNKIQSEIELHVNGKRFKKAKIAFEEEKARRAAKAAKEAAKLVARKKRFAGKEEDDSAKDDDSEDDKSDSSKSDN